MFVYIRVNISQPAARLCLLGDPLTPGTVRGGSGGVVTRDSFVTANQIKVSSGPSWRDDMKAVLCYCLLHL